MTNTRFASFLAVLAPMVLVLARAQTNPSPAQASPEEMARDLGIELPPRPWHLVNLWWDFDGPTPEFQRFDIDVTIDRDIPETYNLYIAPVGLGKFNGVSFYGGLQSNVNGWNSKTSRRRVHPGKGAIFSRWSSGKKTPIGLDHVRMRPGGLCESAGYEGEFCSVRRPYDWTAGTYTWSLVKGETVQHKGAPHTWVTCEVRSHQDNKTTKMGSLLFEGERLSFWARNSAFVEVYSTSKIPVSAIPACHVTFGYPRINGTAPRLTGATVHYPRKAGEGPAAPPCAKVVEAGSAIRVEVGPIVPEDKMDLPRRLRISAPE